jgi:hypothetical protein
MQFPPPADSGSSRSPLAFRIKMPDPVREHNAVDDFCERITFLTGLDTKVIGWPDDENPGKGCNDALLLRGSEEVALDHTRVQSFKDHFKDNALLESIVSPLQDSLRGLYPGHRVRITIQVRGLPKGNRDEMREHLREECIRVLPDVPEDGKRHEYRFVTVPCKVWITKRRSQIPGFFIGRYLPGDQDTEIYNAMLTGLKSKSKQFARFKDKGMQTILLLETEDFSSLDESTIPDVFSLAVPQCDLTSIDEVYLLFRYPNDFLILPIKMGGRSYPNLGEFAIFSEIQNEMI